MTETIAGASIIVDIDEASLIDDPSFIEDPNLVAKASVITDITLLKPDLAINFGEITVPTTFPNEQGTVKVVVTNQGIAQFKEPLDINLYASTDPVLNKPLNTLNFPLEGTDELLGTRKLKNVNFKLGQSKTFTLDFANSNFRTASVVAPGSYYLIAEVVPSKTIAESNQTNNLASTHISTNGSDAVIDWNATLLNAIQASGQGGLPGTPPPLAARNQAIVHAAIYDAVNAIDRSHSSYLVDVDLSEVEDASPEAAAVGAAYEALLKLYPTQKTTFDAQRDRSLAEIADGEAKEVGFALGVSVADQILELRSTDGADTAQRPYTPGTEPGHWEPTPPNYAPALLPGWGEVIPFAISSSSEFLLDGPPEFGSDEYAEELNEVKALGAKNSTVRTAEQTQIAQFWAYDRPDTFRPPGQWNQIAEEVALKQGNTLEENARLFALLNIAEADAGITAWDAKYTYDQLRPITAIRNADNDGNPDTTGDPNWEPLLTTPPFPDYISGHSTFGGAAGEILARFFGDNTSFSVTSQELPGVTRSYGSFTQAADENGISRIYGGIHTHSANEDGLATGRNVANYVFEHILV